MYMAGVCDEQIQAFQNMVRNEDAQVTMQEKVKAEEQNRARQTVPTMVTSGSVVKKDGSKEQIQAPTTKSYVVTKLRDKGSARELRKQLNDYLTSIDKAGTSIYEWEMRVAEIEDEMETIHKSRQRGKSA
ncbi:hypothetical protein HJC23_000115 [Cyclotella cryptica]|uniref:Uncharacterized protein n=1 Tax=Cyclotella cryptica TaxID=29204 RepID=A0ABD3P2D6_9STRA|eukprot:CCRYP_018921-RB/>CCRYP_018921-RB protein AED:0.44 eAED:0.54 QI:0/1/0.5/1/1/1/2/40/129